MNGIKYLILVFSPLVFFFGCDQKRAEKSPNVILIMADDMGYETLACYGGLSYSTPVLDTLANSGIRFDHCVSQPLCTPSRVKIMTGLYNYRNYGYFGHLDDDQHTFGHLFKQKGYATCIAGKWQLNGLAYPDSISNWNDPSRPQQLGFDEYSLWQLTQTRSKGERYSDPLIEQNGEILSTDIDDYGPDIFCQFILDFMERKKKDPFFIYYPMVLVHDPFVPTPDSEEWKDESRRTRKDTSYFGDMVQYTDKIVGRIYQKLSDLNLMENTILIFTADNGTHPSIFTQTKKGRIRGGKGKTTAAGTHVPLIIHWGANVHQPFIYDELVEFGDFYATFADLLNIDVQVDGKSFLDVISKGQKDAYRNSAFVHYDPKWGKNVNRYRNQFVRSKNYKLYQNGNFYHIEKDQLELHALPDSLLSIEQQKIKNELKKEFDAHPQWK